MSFSTWRFSQKQTLSDHQSSVANRKISKPNQSLHWLASVNHPALNRSLQLRDDLGGVNISSLFIAGNGFDIAHGIQTKYSDFRSFIISMYPEVLYLRDVVVYLEDFEDIDPNEFAAEILLNSMDKASGENWCNFEEALAYINFDNKFPMPNHKEDETDEEDQELIQDYLLYMDMLTSGFINCSKMVAKKALIVYKNEMILLYEKIFKKHNVSIPDLYIRKMKILWGSSTPGKGKITLNEYPLKADIRCIQYVVFH